MLSMYDRALQGREKALGPEHPDTLSTAMNLAILLGLQRKFDEAKVFCKRCEIGYAKIYGPDHPKNLDMKALIDLLS